MIMIPNGEKEVYRYLRQAIHDEMSFLEGLCKEIEPVIAKAERADQEDLVIYSRAAGSILHDFYTGIERIFQAISKHLDGGLPKGERWHIELLESMAESRRTRPQVISADLKEELKEYLGFRHLFRNIYGIELKWDKLKDLLLRLRESIWEEFCKALEQFDDFLHEMLEKNEEKRLEGRAPDDRDSGSSGSI